MYLYFLALNFTNKHHIQNVKIYFSQAWQMTSATAVSRITAPWLATTVILMVWEGLQLLFETLTSKNKSNFFLESIVMLVGGRTTGNRKNFKPWFFSLNPALVPLPSCLTGSKSNIDSFHRHRAPLIIGQGIMLSKSYRCMVMQGGGLMTTCNLVSYFRWETTHVWWCCK